MLPHFVSRIASTLTPIGLSVALIATGCDAPSQQQRVGSQSEVRAGGGGPSAWVVAAGDELADAIVADPAFDQLVGVAAKALGDLYEAQQQLPDEELESIALTTSHPSFAEVMGPGTLLGHLGGDPQHPGQLWNLVDQLRANHGLGDASPEDIRYVFELALATEEANMKVKTALDAELAAVTPGFDPCEQACHNAYVAIALIAMAIFVIEMAVAAATFPWGLIIAAFAVAQLNATLAEAQAERDECIAACDGIIIDVDVCGGDSVCEQDEYCWTGVFGIGDDECRPKKKQGKVCSNHAKCLSGCCKYHFLSHPVSKTCRPANKCN
ncbi:MAG: hypothetical protein K0V04_31590 [Deltaproteobacteria bacterium]|nr:hypothetical protein [Deltaproteobacteria bacterium]